MATPAAVLSIIVEANTGKAEAALKEFQRNLSKADREKAEAELAFQVEKGGYNVFSGLVKKADAMSAKASLGFDVDQGSLAKARAGQALVTKESNALSDVLNRSKLSYGQLLSLMVAGSPIIFDVAGALGALTASLGAATAGFGALAVGIGGVMTVGFGGIAAIAAPAISSLKDLMTAQEAADKAKVTGSGSAARASVASAQQIIAAEQQLQTAQQSAELAQESLTQARQDAVRQLQDMRRAAMGAAANEESAQISLDRARQNLRQVMRDEAAGALDVREAENEVVLARQSLRDVTIQGNRAQKDYNAAQKGGIDQMSGVVSAQQSLDSATQGVADAMRNLATQQKEANMAAGAGATSIAALALAAKKAGPAAVKFAQHIKEMGQRWRGLTREGKNDFFGMLDDGLGRLNKKLPMLAESANKSMKALRGGFNTFLKTATGPEFDHFVDVMTNTFAKSIGPVSKAFGNIAKVLQRIAVAVAPDLVKMAKDFRGMTQGWLDSTRNAGKLRETVHGLVGQTRAWWDLLVAAKDLIVAVLVPGMGEGKKAVQDMTDQLKEWTNWANAHPKEIRDFMKEGLETTRQLVQVLISFLPQLFEIAKAIRPIARLFLSVTKALNSIKVGNVSLLTGLIGAFVAAKFIRAMAAFRGTLAMLGGGAVARGAAALLGLSKAPPIPPTTVAQSPFGAPIPGGDKAGKAAGGVFSRAFGVAARAGLLGAAAVGIYGAFTSRGGIIDTIKGKGSVTGEELADEMSSKFIQNFAPRINNAIRNLNFKALRGITGETRRMIAAFEDAGIDIPDSLRQFARSSERAVERVKESFGDWRHSLGQLRHVIFRNLDDIKDETRDALRAINRIQGLSNDKREQMVVKTYRAEVNTIRKSMKLGLIAHKEGHQQIEKIQRKILRAYGVKDVQRLIVSDKVLGGLASQFKQRGGPIGGSGEGDKVPAMLEPGEFVVNKKATKVARGALEDLNRQVPRFQTGGVVDRTGVSHFAKGGMATMIAEANKFERRGFPYTWGGGHSDFGIQPVDCSGAVSQVLHAAGLLKAPMVSGDLAHWGKAGKGPLTVYANPEHTFMSLAGRFFGTSSTNPAGGAGWFAPPDRGYLSGFAARTMEVVGRAAAKIKLPRFKATALAATGTAASLNTIASVGEMAIREATRQAGGGFGGGQTLKDFSKGPGKVVGASVYGFGEPGTGTVGASGVSLPGKPAFAELDMGTALGHLPFGKKVGIEVGGKKAVGVKLDIGAGGGAVGGHHRAIDFWRDLAEKLGLSGSFLGLAKVRGLQKGGMVAAPYVGAFQQGGDVAKTGLGLLHEGERVVPKMAQGGLVAGRRARPDAQGGGRRGDDDRRGGGLGVERIQRIRERLGKQLSQVVPKLDEEIDIAERLAGLTTSPGGSEMAKSEIDKQLRLQRGLLRILRNTLNIAKRGMGMVQRVMKRIEDGIKELQRKIAREQKQMEQQVKRLTKFIESERKKDKPDQKKIEKAQGKLRDVKARHARPLERWQKELGKYNKAAPRLPEMRSGFREAIVELSGLTGRGGRIFDTSLSVKELQASKAPQAIGIEELLAFAEAMRFGAFNRQLGTAGNIPTFAQGGIHRGGLALVGERGPEVVQMPPAQVFPTGTAPTAPEMHFDVRVYVGDKEITDIVRTEISEKNRKSTSRYRAGVMRP